MVKYYTKACNFHYGHLPIKTNKKYLTLNGDKNLHFSSIEIISRKSKKRISISQIQKLPSKIKIKVEEDIKKIIKKKKI